MEFLKELVGEELYNQLMSKINEHNEDNKDNPIKLGNLGTGEYVGKGKFEAVQELLNGKETELTTANGLIEELKKATKGDETLQGKISDYEAENAKLQAELHDIKTKSAIKVALISESAFDVDYLTYKLEETLKEKGKTLELDENGNLKEQKELVDGLKIQFPAQFVSGGNKKIIENKLPNNDADKSISKSDLLKKPYSERAKIYNENPEAYKAAMNE